MKKVLFNILIFVWAVIAIATTVSLLSMNKYRITEFGNYSFIAVDSNNLKPDYDKGTLIVAKKTTEDIKTDDDIFYYDSGTNAAIVNLGKVTEVTKVNETETTFTMQNGQGLSSEYVIGSAKEVKIVKNIGTIITILQSKWGFMFIVIFPSIFLVIYEVYNIIVEIRKDGKKEE